MRIAFMGTPDFAQGALEALIEAGHEIAVVVTQPDKEKGRGKQVQFPPVKECAIAHNLPVFQPVKIREPQCVETMRGYQADLFVVAAFGQILTKELLDMPKYGCINIHASLLPKYRGAAPIQWSILDGEEYTGVTIQQMNEGIDTGDILSMVKVRIEEDETGDSLFEKLKEIGAKLCVDTIRDIEAGNVKPTPQNEAEASYAKKLSKELGRLDFNENAAKLERFVRGLNSWPSAYTRYKDKQLKIWKAASLEGKSGAKPGEVIAVTRDRIVVQCGEESALSLLEIQLEGKKRMEVKDFLLGYHVEPGEILGE